MDQITVLFGKRIRSIRNSKNISQERLAEMSGLHPTYIGQLERGEKSPTLESIYKISKGLEMTVGALFSHMEGTSEEESYAVKLYNKVLPLSSEKQEIIYKIISEIIQL
ncbi:MAG: helix-turn-helix transcriptional regulator [Oscillospiraceae bacterium]|nr:helix-turn-helix transcriptional regulator [Oscillospiraceae bacterium]